MAQIATLDTSPRVYLALDGTKYVPGVVCVVFMHQSVSIYNGVYYIGIVGVNVIKANDYMNVILQVIFSLTWPDHYLINCIVKYCWSTVTIFVKLNYLTTRINNILKY